jgi:hypothetical protein
MGAVPSRITVVGDRLTRGFTSHVISPGSAIRRRGLGLESPCQILERSWSFGIDSTLSPHRAMLTFAICRDIA